MSVFIWVMMGIAFWHFTVLVPDRFWGGIIGAFVAALAGAVASGYTLPEPGIPTGNPPGIAHVFWAAPGAVAALTASYFYGAHREAKAARQA